ncbi:hypothetical protein SS1G_01078 [Sclerotinia sclerotiorum 1980 UF-70]|uniref:Uncharacterized protein n=1 Tax=Sclerotinia sclerotiorum (strain ATCC 18683 / 1980 / Ss-1) TaxID=665079 RepID=A7E702_SCLS1|nr:hypothetical protein SS1G_01078 [Sclerotinia sclerotiorum 1980 UF-70]EDN96154.1 hypothetical protein SS1G_01078 [Sclerotinia sclerotiorum 1980 UF-70]
MSLLDLISCAIGSFIIAQVVRRRCCAALWLRLKLVAHQRRAGRMKSILLSPKEVVNKREKGERGRGRGRGRRNNSKKGGSRKFQDFVWVNGGWAAGAVNLKWLQPNDDNAGKRK